MRKQLFFDLRLKLRDSGKPFFYWHNFSNSPEPYTELILSDNYTQAVFEYGDEMIKIIVQEDLKS